MKDITGPNNPNYRHGGYASWNYTDQLFQIAIAKDKLKTILTTPFDSHGRCPGFSQEEVAWALRVFRNRPEWAEKTLKEIGL